MRADRLVAVLMLLQTRGRITAAEVAAELEISERTARRDLDALAMAGLPVYSQPGRNGGWQILGGGPPPPHRLYPGRGPAPFPPPRPPPAAPPREGPPRPPPRAPPPARPAPPPGGPPRRGRA